MSKIQIAFCVGLFFLQLQPVFGWYEHQRLMPTILSNVPPEFDPIFSQKVSVPCAYENQLIYQKLVQEFQLNPDKPLPSNGIQGCGPGVEVTVKDILESPAVDDPDQGMDQDLPDAYDRKGAKKWMGGSQGGTSQGYRHMYFGGWKLSSPIATFQLPISAIGEAPERAELFALKAKEFLRAGNLAWGTRLLGWALHYIQDLSQPFHSAELIHMKMAVWSELLKWPLSTAFQDFVKSSVHSVTNYHWAYETYIDTIIRRGEQSVLADCLSTPDNYAVLKFDPKKEGPKQLAHIVTQNSIQIASKLGETEMDFFPASFKSTDVDIPKKVKSIDFSEYGIRPDLNAARQALHEVTCQALANGSHATRALIRWAFEKDQRTQD